MALMNERPHRLVARARAALLLGVDTLIAGSKIDNRSETLHLKGAQQ